MSCFSRTLVFISLLAIHPYGHAQDVIGKTYPIVEEDFLAYIQERLSTLEKQGKIDDYKKKAQETTRHYVDQPTGEHVPKATESVTRYFDPSISVPYDIYDGQGRILHRADTVVNPLLSVSLSSQLLFFNGNDQDQVKWAFDYAQKAGWRVKPILTEGSPADLMRTWKKRVFFDQKGFLVEKLGIQQVPAIVKQEDKVLRIDEIKI